MGIFQSVSGQSSEQSIRLAAAHSQLYRSCKVSPTLYQSGLRISNHRGHKFPPLLTLLSFKTRITSSVESNRKFSECIFSTPVIFKATSKLFSSQGCSDDNCLYFSSIFFNICRFRNSILLSL